MRLRIPEQQMEALAGLIRLSATDRGTLVEALQRAPPRLQVRDFAQPIADAMHWDLDRAAAATSLLGSMYVVRSDSGETVDDFIDKVFAACAATGREDLRLSPEGTEGFRGFLRIVLERHDTLGLAAKGFDLSQEHERSFCRARIVTDIRPIFKAGTDDQVAAAIVQHQLRITYHRGDEEEAITFGLDTADLKELSRLLGRALRKEESVAATLGPTVVMLRG